MFLDIGWSEMALILAVALVVIGPKDLPRVARQVGRWTAKARSMAREFQRSIDDMAREAELQDLKAEIDKMSRTNFGAEIERTIDPDGEMRRAIEPPRLHGVEAAPKAEEAAADLAAANAGEPPSVPAPPAEPLPALPEPEPASGTVTHPPAIHAPASDKV